MRRAIVIVALLLSACSGSNLDTSRGPNGEAIVGNQVAVQISNAASQSAAFSLAENYCRKHKRSARFVAQNSQTNSFDCVRTT